MQILIKLVLLALTFFLVFVNPAYIGKAVYYSFFPVLFLLVGWLYRISYLVGEKDIQRVTDEPFSYSLFCAMVPLDGQEDLKRGRLIVTETHLKLFQRTKSKKEPCKMTYSLPIAQLEGISVETVLGNRKGFTFHLESHNVSFVYRKAEQEKNLLIKALGWQEEPNVGEDASRAPSFKDL